MNSQRPGTPNSYAKERIAGFSVPAGCAAKAFAKGVVTGTPTAINAAAANVAAFSAAAYATSAGATVAVLVACAQV
ncbi:hypothetical protein ACQPZF_26545 [Actinosynnema sp. CS-041913]|uniref:hypothetical protein n=1 Tax=Actinosynnema sp. CS-041913 TaxID=3239917 RepID=UPI003D92FC0C